MIKRMTLLARKEGMAVSDFRGYWSGCHAELALCMDGITNYTQNRVEKTLWQQADEDGCFQIDGIVELCFEGDEVMGVAQRSSIGSKYIPEDEPNFLRGWSLCVVDHEDAPEKTGPVKVIVVAVLNDPNETTVFRNVIDAVCGSLAMSAKLAVNLTTRTAKRERLWAEPVFPHALVALWFEDVAQAHFAFETDGPLVRAISAMSGRAAAYLIDTLVKK